jgi:hypothetical protein
MRITPSSTDRSILLALLVLAVLLGCASEPPRPKPGESVRPRIGQIVDADTGQPIAGALVLDVFYLWPKRGFGNFPTPKVFRDSAETLTDRDGRFTLTGPFDDGSWWTDGIYIFKAGYGPWRFKGDTDRGPAAEIYSWRKNAWEQFTTVGAVIELRPLRTREERVKYIDRGWDPADRLEPGFGRSTPFEGPTYFFNIPADRLSQFQQAVDAERAALGLPHRRLDGHLQPR